MSRVIAICSLALVFGGINVSAQEPSNSRNSDSASQYSFKNIGETPSQRQRRLRDETARELVFEKAAQRAARRDDRIATARALGISHARPDYQRQTLFDAYWWTLPRIIYIEVIEPVDPSPGTAARDSRRY